MKRLSVAAALTLFGTHAAADWTLVGGVENVFSAYADAATIRRHGSLVDMWGIYDFNKADISVDGHKHLSTGVLREYDCSEPRVRASSALMGSSMRRTRGFIAKARASATR